MQLDIKNDIERANAVIQNAKQRNKKEKQSLKNKKESEA
jgi:hypothetical protein